MGVAGFRCALLLLLLLLLLHSPHAAQRLLPIALLAPSPRAEQAPSLPPSLSTLHPCSVYFVPTGLITLQLLQKWGVHMDWITFAFILFNFAVRVSAACAAAVCPCLGLAHRMTGRSLGAHAVVTASSSSSHLTP